jgi:hypothetical protein
MDSQVPMHNGMRSRPAMDDDTPERPVNGWNNGGPYGGPHRPYNDRDPHSIPVAAHSLQMRDNYDRPISAPNHHGGMNSMHGHG